MERKYENIRDLGKRRELAEMVYASYGGTITDEEKPEYDNEVGAAFEAYVHALHDIEEQLYTERGAPGRIVMDFINKILGRKEEQ